MPPGTYSVTKWSLDADWKAHSRPRMKGWRTWREACVGDAGAGGVMWGGGRGADRRGDGTGRANGAHLGVLP